MRDPFEVLTTPLPAVDEAAAERILEQHFGIAGDLEPLASERDRNYLVSPPNGEKAVLKIANSAEDRLVTELQTEALLHIAESAPDIAAPRIRPSFDGDSSVEIVADDGRRHVARVVSWLDGTPLQYVERDPGCAATLGSVLARLGQALRHFTHDASDYALLWDLKRASHLKDLLDCVSDSGLRSICAARLDRFDSWVAPRLEGVRWQVIHNDLNPSNVLVDPENPSHVLGVIDFGDMLRSPLIVDVAVAAAYLLRDEPDATRDVLEFARAYSRIEPLDELELDILFDLTLSRSTMTVLITHWRAAHYPENRDYILRNETRARKLLERLHGVSESDIAAQLREKCLTR